MTCNQATLWYVQPPVVSASGQTLAETSWTDWHRSDAAQVRLIWYFDVGHSSCSMLFHVVPWCCLSARVSWFANASFQSRHHCRTIPYGSIPIQSQTQIVRLKFFATLSYAELATSDHQLQRMVPAVSQQHRDVSRCIALKCWLRLVLIHEKRSSRLNTRICWAIQFIEIK